jgi:hypothetical protein
LGPSRGRLRDWFNYWLERTQTQIRLGAGSKRIERRITTLQAHLAPRIGRRHDRHLSDRHRVHVRKTALIFAALDMVDEIHPDHYSAAIEYTDFLYDPSGSPFAGTT